MDYQTIFLQVYCTILETKVISKGQQEPELMGNVVSEASIEATAQSIIKEAAIHAEEIALHFQEKIDGVVGVPPTT